MTIKLSMLNSLAWAIVAGALLANVTFAQSVSIKKAEGQFKVEGTTATTDPVVIQGSQDMRLWIDMQPDLSDTLSYTFTPTELKERYFRLAPKVDAPPIRVMIIGDSMSADCCGWGAGMYLYFRPDATVVNYAMAWASSKVFLQSAEMEKMLLIKPNYVLMQFAWIDGSAGDVDRMTTLEEFESNLRTLIDTVRGFNGVPILITLQAARSWDASGKLIYSDHPRNAITRRLAAELNVHLIDLYKITFDLFTELGPTRSAFFNWAPGGPEDVMHMSTLGAQWASRLIAQQFPADLAPYLTGILDPPPPAP